MFKYKPLLPGYRETIFLSACLSHFPVLWRVENEKPVGT
jgi:hypothetical protein